MIKELLKDNNRRYFLAEGEQGNILFNIYEWENESKTLEEIETALLSAKIPSYITDNHSTDEIFNKPLAIFQLSIYSFGSELQPKNMSLWEYETFIKKNSDVPKALQMAFISQPHDEDGYYICCESYDNESMTTNKNVNTVYEWVNKLSRELEELLNKSFNHVEVYR